MADGDRPKTSNTRRNAEKTPEYSSLALKIRHQSKLKLPTIEEVDEEEKPQIKDSKPQTAISDIDSNASTQASFNSIKEENSKAHSKSLNTLNIKCLTQENAQLKFNNKQQRKEYTKKRDEVNRIKGIIKFSSPDGLTNAPQTLPQHTKNTKQR